MWKSIKFHFDVPFLRNVLEDILYLPKYERKQNKGWREKKNRIEGYKARERKVKFPYLC